jgi:predicted nucleic acid-binding Zn ribbon protein
MSADPLVICPKCAKPTLKRLMSSGVGLLFKGSGFYQTDYKKSSVSTGSSEKKPEAKPESKIESKPDKPPTPETPASPDKK